MASISPQAGSISAAMRSYKSAVTRWARPMVPDFGWQARFHDHVIRSTAGFQRVSYYILHNPENWREDCFVGG